MTGLTSSLKLILCLQKEGLIPGISDVFQVNASMFETETSLPFHYVSSKANMTTGEEKFPPRLAYSRCFEEVFNHDVGRSWIDVLILSSSFGGNSSKSS
ncbi:hypothetical protein Tco_0273555 [Tanacetum coccineum]